MRSLFIAAAALIAAQPAHAEVVAAAPESFHVRHTVDVPVSRADAWRALTRIGRWWSSEHTWSGDAANMRLSAQAGGCFCERWGQTSVEHARVILAQPHETLRLRGELGPLQEMPAYGVLTFALAEAENGARVTLTYQVSGPASLGLATIAPAVDGVLGQQMARYARYAGTGAPD